MVLRDWRDLQAREINEYIKGIGNIISRSDGFCVQLI